LIKDDGAQNSERLSITHAQLKAGDIASAQKSVDLIQGAGVRDEAQNDIALTQIKAGDIAGAQATANTIQNASWKTSAQSAIAQAQAKNGITNAPHSTRQSTSDIPPPIQPVITASDWLKKLDDDNKSNDCPLNTEPFLDLAGYLKTLPPSDNPQNVFESLRETAEKIVSAQNVITGMLKQQAKP
jgi:hypothetical protein